MTRRRQHVTQEIDLRQARTRPAYPLTMVIYAMVPTSGVSDAKAAAIARFLDYVAGPGPEPRAPRPASCRPATCRCRPRCGRRR